MKDKYITYMDGTVVKSPAVAILKRLMAENNISTKVEMIEWYHLMINDCRTRPKGLGKQCLNLLEDLTVS
tara:strand:+ start:892 stop:1101 length:210 start_codon:yes stop_codon:yes gene_type:complete